MFPVRTILYAADLEDESEPVFRLACSLAHDSGARLVVLHVAEPPPFVSPGELQKLLGLFTEYRQQLVAKLQSLRPDVPGVLVEYQLANGDPVTEILQEAGKIRSDLIVLGTHGRRGLGRVLLGSVAEQVLRRARCPVMTVKLPAPQRAGPAEAEVSSNLRRG